ncbi:hypothetical protein AVEN_83080-1, partial [Araneus ventricosus]
MTVFDRIVFKYDPKNQAAMVLYSIRPLWPSDKVWDRRVPGSKPDSTEDPP